MMHERNNAQSSQEKKDSAVFHQQCTQAWPTHVGRGVGSARAQALTIPSHHTGAARVIASHMEAHARTHTTHTLGALITECGFRQQGGVWVWDGKSLRLRNKRAGLVPRRHYFLTPCPPVRGG